MVLSDWGALRLSFTIVLCNCIPTGIPFSTTPASQPAHQSPACPQVPITWLLYWPTRAITNYANYGVVSRRNTSPQKLFPPFPRKPSNTSLAVLRPRVRKNLTSGSRTCKQWSCLKALAYALRRALVREVRRTSEGLNSLLLRSYLSVIGEAGDAVSACPVDVGGWLLRWGVGGVDGGVGRWGTRCCLIPP